ncbi:hypothetical protein [Thermoactinospora rubra]|uniref:hypothetical protein n=1 Tax=Thermoactinospora rubra TaxID=1088767 RepID=UPI000A12326B|nr:hypothetical protein [Thermoactinospora rubra]
MTDQTMALLLINGAVLGVLAAAGAGVLIRRRTARRGARHRHPSGRRLAEGLDYPVFMPGWHPETWPQQEDWTDVHLAELHDQLWPGEEWTFVLDCPHPLLPGYATHAELQAPEPGHEPYPRDGEPYECACGRLHIRRPGRRTRRARRRASRTGGSHG